METNNKPVTQNNEISIIEIIETIKKYYRYLISKWVIICIFGFGGAAIGLVASFLIKPKYTAHLSFALIEKAPGGGLADLASSFGFSGLMGAGNNGAFSGDNLLEIIKSRRAIEQTLLTPINYNNQNITLVEVYIDFMKLRDIWKSNSENDILINLSFPINQKRDSLTRTQDSVLNAIYEKIINSKSLKIARRDKKVSVVNVEFTCENEFFSKSFIESLMYQTYSFYKDTKTAQSRFNIEMMQSKADSIKNIYEESLYKGAGISQVNINQALQFAAIPRIKQESNTQLYGTVYTEILKNLETLKLDLARETPIVQIIDSPRYPLKKEYLTVSKGVAFGGLIGTFLISFSLIIIKYLLTLYQMSKKRNTNYN
jgi:hypothetical protein